MDNKSNLVGSYKLKGEMISLAYASLKDVLPAITRYKVKTNSNDIILGKWQKRKK